MRTPPKTPTRRPMKAPPVLPTPSSAHGLALVRSEIDWLRPLVRQARQIGGEKKPAIDRLQRTTPDSEATIPHPSEHGLRRCARLKAQIVEQAGAVNRINPRRDIGRVYSYATIDARKKSDFLHWVVNAAPTKRKSSLSTKIVFSVHSRVGGLSGYLGGFRSRQDPEMRRRRIEAQPQTVGPDRGLRPILFCGCGKYAHGSTAVPAWRLTAWRHPPSPCKREYNWLSWAWS